MHAGGVVSECCLSGGFILVCEEEVGSSAESRMGAWVSVATRVF